MKGVLIQWERYNLVPRLFSFMLGATRGLALVEVKSETIHYDLTRLICDALYCVESEGLNPISQPFFSSNPSSNCKIQRKYKSRLFIWVVTFET